MAKKPETSASEQKKEDWMNSKWRPMMGWMYMAVCVMDFVAFPILWSLLQSLSHGQVTSQWQPLTLQGAGLFHIAMGGVLGLAAYGRTQEKMAGANNGGMQFPAGAGTTYVPPGGATNTNINLGTYAPAPATSSFGAPRSFGYAPPAFGSEPPAFGSKPLGPPPAPQPLL
jgi:hypothetical protein